MFYTRKTPLVISTILILQVLTASYSFAQSSWRKGSVTKNDGTTLTGEINDKEWTVNPSAIEFRGEDQKVTTLTVSDIKSFTTDRPSRYESFEVIYDGDDQNINEQLTSDRNPLTLAKDHIFLEVLVNAPVGLLRFHDAGGREHFMLRKGNSVEELLNRIYRLPENKTMMGKNEKYKQQLMNEALTCKELQSSFKSIKYNEASLKGIINKVNACLGNSIEPLYTGVVAKKKSDFGVVVQPFFSYTEFTSMFSNMSKVNFGGGLFYEIYNKRKPGRISLYNELIYKNINQDATNFLNQTVNLKLSRVKLINSYRFSYSKGDKGRTFWGIGISTGVRFNTLVNDKETIPGYGDYNASTFELGVIGSLGKTFVVSDKFRINTELRYELEQVPFTSSIFVGAHNIGLNLGFNFRK